MGSRYYIDELTHDLHDLTDELYESFFDDKGNYITNGDYFDTGVLLNEIINKAQSALDDLSENINEKS